MERYKIIREIGDGTCGNVFMAYNVETNEIVAVKKMKRKFFQWEECVSLREVKVFCFVSTKCITYVFRRHCFATWYP
jgi:serine/threonine protein kinase